MKNLRAPLSFTILISKDTWKQRLRSDKERVIRKIQFYYHDIFLYKYINFKYTNYFNKTFV